VNRNERLSGYRWTGWKLRTFPDSLRRTNRCFRNVHTELFLLNGCLNDNFRSSWCVILLNVHYFLWQRRLQRILHCQRKMFLFNVHENYWLCCHRYKFLHFRLRLLEWLFRNHLMFQFVEWVLRNLPERDRKLRLNQHCLNQTTLISTYRQIQLVRRYSTICAWKLIYKMTVKVIIEWWARSSLLKRLSLRHF
jgi:hypothetical protein